MGVMGQHGAIRVAKDTVGGDRIPTGLLKKLHEGMAQYVDTDPFPFFD